MPVSNYLPDESSPLYAISDPERARTIGWEDLPARDMAQAGPAGVIDGSMLYTNAEKADAFALATAALRAFFGVSQPQAPYKWAEDEQAAEISYKVEFADQDYRRMNEANSKLTQFRSRLPKVPGNVSTSSIIGNLSASSAESLGSSDNELLAMLGL